MPMAAFYLDLRLTQKVAFGNSGEIEIFGAVTNLTDQAPPVTPYYYAFVAHPIQTNSILFDLVGRRFTIGAKLGF